MLVGPFVARFSTGDLCTFDMTKVRSDGWTRKNPGVTGSNKDSTVGGSTGFEPVTSSVSEGWHSGLGSGLAAMTCAYVGRALLSYLEVSCVYIRDPCRSRAVVGPSPGSSRMISSG